MIGAAQVDIIRRTDGPGQYLLDFAQTNVMYEGRTPEQATLTSDHKWQIKRISQVAGVRKVEYANVEKYNVVWDDRASYFTPIAPDATQILSEFSDSNVVTTNALGDVCFRVCGETSITGSRAVGGDFAEITVNDAGWTDLTTPFTDILQLSVQNKSGVQCKVSPVNTAGYSGITLEDDEERNYNDLDTGFKVYGRAQTGTAILFVEVLKNA